MADETKEVEALIGPYRGKRLTMSAADADAAINDHWAIDPFEVADDDHPPLTDEERSAALDAANAWSDAQQAAASGEEPPPPPEGGITRSMGADDAGKYKTRSKK